MSVIQKNPRGILVIGTVLAVLVFVIWFKFLSSSTIHPRPAMDCILSADIGLDYPQFIGEPYFEEIPCYSGRIHFWEFALQLLIVVTPSFLVLVASFGIYLFKTKRKR